MIVKQFKPLHVIYIIDHGELLIWFTGTGYFQACESILIASVIAASDTGSACCSD